MYFFKTASFGYSKYCTVAGATKNHEESLSPAKFRSSKLYFQMVLAFLFIQFYGTMRVVTGDSYPGGYKSTFSPFRVASFNIRHFGVTKMSRKNVSEAIVSIIKRYDLVYIMETRDKMEKSLEQLKKQLGESEWDYIASQPLGRSSYKEQHVFFYRPSVLTPRGSFIYQNQSQQDDFERQPMTILFEYLSSYTQSMVNVSFVGAHLAPKYVVKEMEALVSVISKTQQVYRDSSAVILMGDLNADCSYMNCAEREMATLFSSPEVYTNLVPNKMDTTVSPSTHCAYDRVVMTVQDRLQIRVSNVTPYDFEKGLNLSFDDAWSVSDHYPVEFTIE